MIILGAGLAGCIAGHLFPGSRILEAASAASGIGAHKALLRFRTDAISKITGIPFRKVRVHKSVFYHGEHYLSEVPIPLMNMYSRKVTGALSERSIASLAPVDRFIAPTNFHELLVDQLAKRIEFSWPVKSVSPILIMREGDEQGIDRREEAVISTIPLPVLLEAAHMRQGHLLFVRAPIFVNRYAVRRSDVFQTIYFPSPNVNVYRASITANLLIVESVRRAEVDMEMVAQAFGLEPEELEPIRGGVTTQQYGKIVPLADDARHAILLRLTREAHVYSFGRFATWRNLLMDDLPADADRIRMLMRMTDYEAILESAK